MNLDDIIEELGQIDGVEACILYRIDGNPIRSRILGFKEVMLDILNWLEKQVNYARSTVLVVVMNPNANQLLVSVEVTRASEKINEIISK